MNMLMGKHTLGTISLMGGVSSCHTEFMYSLAQMIQYNNEYVCEPGQVIHLDRADVSYHSAARNQLVSRFLGDWMLMLDLDHAFAPDLLARMLYMVNLYRHRNVEIGVLSGMYHYRVKPYLPVAFMWNEKKTGCNQITDWESDGILVEIDSGGGGCLLVQRKVFNRIYEELNEEPFSIRNGLSEDHSFFYRLMLLGIKAYLAPGIQAAHLATVPITTEGFYKDRFDKLSKAVEIRS